MCPFIWQSFSYHSPEVAESRDRPGHVTVIIFLSGDKDVDCRATALILHALLPTSTLGMFSTGTKKRETALRGVCRRVTLWLQRKVWFLDSVFILHLSQKKRSLMCFFFCDSKFREVFVSRGRLLGSIVNYHTGSACSKLFIEWNIYQQLQRIPTCNRAERRTSLDKSVRSSIAVDRGAAGAGITLPRPQCRGPTSWPRWLEVRSTAAMIGGSKRASSTYIYWWQRCCGVE